MDGWPAGARLPTGKVASTVTVALVMPAWRAITRVPRLPSPAAGKISHHRTGSAERATMNSTIAPRSQT